MSRTLAQIEKDGFDTLTEDETNAFKGMLMALHELTTNKWPKEMGEASDLLLRTYGWHLRLWMHPNDLIPFMLKNNDAVDHYFIGKLRMAGPRLWFQSCRRFPGRRKMINRAFRAHLAGIYSASVPLFLLLSEGIFRELTGEDLFAKKQKPKIVAGSRKDHSPEIMPMMIHIINSVSNGDIIGLRFSGDEYLKFPNVLSRNKILHGADPDYGTKVNSYKALSQFEFVMESVYAALTGKGI